MEHIKDLLNSVTERMFNIAQDGFEEECPIGIIDFANWEWSQAVGLYGLWQYYKMTGDTEILSKIKKWYDNNLEKGLPERNVNTTAPMLTLAFLAEETKDEGYLELCKDWAKWVMYDLKRTEEGGIQHVVSGMDNDQQLWDDTLFMTVLFLAKAGAMFGVQEYIDEAIKQFLVHIKYLYDTKTGFWYHGWCFNGRHNFAEAFWARGNCWYTCVVVDFLEITGVNGYIREHLVNTLISQIEALSRVQTESGAFRTLLDDENSYIEISATAGFAYGILKSVKKGLIDEKYAEIGLKAVDAVINNISDDGTVNNVSYGTGMGSTLKDYTDIPLCPMTYGQALTILALKEYMCFQNNK